MDLSPEKTECMLLLRRPKPPQSSGLGFQSSKSKTVTNSLSRRQTTTPGSSLNTSKVSNPSESLVVRNFHKSLTPLLDRNQYEQDVKERLKELSRFTIHPPVPKGPEFFPPGRVIHAEPYNPVLLDVLPDEIHLPDPEHDFTLNDFCLPPPPPHRPHLQISHGTVSRANYLKLTGWFASHVPMQENVNTVKMSVDHQAPPSRVPKAQVLIELQALVRRVLEDESSVLSGDSDASSQLPHWPAPAPNDALFRSATSKFFCGQARSNSPFDARHQPFISPSEAAIIESMMTGGSHLSLKAHFIERLPLLTPLAHTLISLNLSYNSLKVFPTEVFQLRFLVFLSMRNNPLRSIPNGIRSLQNIHFLCFSFCNLSTLPPGLFDLQNIVDLDVSYNNLELIPRSICRLKRLHKLNIEGNRLPGLPSSALCLTVSHIILGNNLMHPLLWRENTKNQPQSLADLCCVVVKKSMGSDADISQLPEEVQERLQIHSSETCDECNETLFGAGLQVIRNVEHCHFKVKNLPFIFTVCSSQCGTLLRKKPAKFWLDR